MGTELPDRKGNRLKGYDYSACGVYFVTVCTQNRVCNLGSVVGADARISPPALRQPEGSAGNYCPPLQSVQYFTKESKICFVLNVTMARVQPCLLYTSDAADD